MAGALWGVVLRLRKGLRADASARNSSKQARGRTGMTFAPKFAFIAAVGLLALMTPGPVSAGPVTANCTGMFNLDVYTFDPALPTQDVANIGTAEVAFSDQAIVLTGAFGEYRFDLKVGTLYHNGSDTGVYCTYSGLAG
jgi:hypothetical protein